MFWVTLSSTVAEVPKGEQLVLVIYANSRPHAREEGCVDDKVLGTCARDTLKINERRLLTYSGESQLALVNTLFRAPIRGISCTFHSPHRVKLPPGLYPQAATKQTNHRNNKPCVDRL